jgi:Cyclic nucleotide-binding domain
MRIESKVTSISWIPSEAVTGPMKASFASGLSHYDSPPPGRIDDVRALRDSDAFRFANELTAWAEFDGGQVVSYGQDGSNIMGATTVQLGPIDATFAAVSMPDLRPNPEIGDGWISFTQTVGGRTALPLPRKISKPPFLRMQSPLVWTTLKLTLHSDGRAVPEMIGASPFPRHWVYGADGVVALKAGVADWGTWLGQPSWTATPWGNEDSPVIVAAAETALERELSGLLMHGAHKPKIRRFDTGAVVCRQGDAGETLFLVLDGILDVTVDGNSLGVVGPGAVVGERAVLEGSPRTATLTGTTAVKVAEAPADAIDRDALARLATGHRREVSVVDGEVTANP